MKKLIIFLTIIFISNAAHAVTIESMMLYGGSISYDQWYHNYQTWDTIPADTWVLGVSSTANGNLLNKSDTSIESLPLTNYYLYADQSRTLGISTNPLLMIKLSDNSIIAAIFSVSGQPGTATQWERVSDYNNIPIAFINNNQQLFSSLVYSNKIELGWAEGVADKVSIEHGLNTDGFNDIYLIGGMQASAVPLPAAPLLLGAGLGRLAIYLRKKLPAKN